MAKKIGSKNEPITLTINTPVKNCDLDWNNRTIKNLSGAPIADPKIKARDLIFLPVVEAQLI